IDSPRITRLLTRMPNRDVKSVALLLNKVPQLLTQSCRIRHPSRIKFTENRKSTLEIRVTERLRVTLHTQRLFIHSVRRREPQIKTRRQNPTRIITTRRDLRQSDRIDIDRLSRKNRKLFLPISKTSRHNRPPSQFPPQGEFQRRPSRPLTPPNRSQQPHWLPPNG